MAGDTIRSVFIFFHEILWNSHEKYIGVKSNSRSRYSNIVKYSNYWEEVHPILLGNDDKNFYIIAGDVGGNSDAIAAFYDTWDNITLLASGMGEVVDENYLLVQVHDRDSIEFGLVPLNPDYDIPDIEYYSVPTGTDSIAGPDIILPGSSVIKYSVPEVFNASSYIWELPEGASGLSTSNEIGLDFTTEFREGIISVQAFREGFGSGPASSLLVKAKNTVTGMIEENSGSLQVNIIENHNFISIGIHRFDKNALSIRLIDTSGRLIMEKQVKDFDKYTELQINKTDIPKGIIFISVSIQTENIIKKIAIW